jgi:hypothetical protein
MKFYGKKRSELTDLEENLLHIDMALCISMSMYVRGESLLSGSSYHDMTCGTQEDIEEKFYTRSEIICEILDIENPDENTIFKIIDKTPYNIQNFCIDFTTQMMGQPNDVYYHYWLKCKELEFV